MNSWGIRSIYENNDKETIECSALETAYARERLEQLVGLLVPIHIVVIWFNDESFSGALFYVWNFTIAAEIVLLISVFIT